MIDPKGVLVSAIVMLAALSVPVGAQEGEEIAVIHSGGESHGFTVEIADDDAERARGLMFREELAPDAGMLFDFVDERPVAFWMQNTLIPLDMLFIAGDGTIRHIHANATPLSTDSIPSEYPVRAVLEINGGSARLLGIKPGDKVRHPIFGNG